MSRRARVVVGLIALAIGAVVFPFAAARQRMFGGGADPTASLMGDEATAQHHLQRLRARHRGEGPCTRYRTEDEPFDANEAANELESAGLVEAANTHAYFAAVFLVWNEEEEQHHHSAQQADEMLDELSSEAGLWDRVRIWFYRAQLSDQIEGNPGLHRAMQDRADATLAVLSPDEHEALHDFWERRRPTTTDIIRMMRIIRPRVTGARMERIADAIRQYVGTHGRAPETLGELPLRAEELIDAWDRPIGYEVGTDRVRLTSDEGPTHEVMLPTSAIENMHALGGRY